MIYKINSIATILILSVINFSFQNQSGNLTVTVTNIKNMKGEIEFLLFNKPEGFPNDAAVAYKTLRAKVINSTCSVSFNKISYGEYAVGIYHDENNNRKLDKAWYGMPKEGVGVSNNPSLGIFSPPKYETAKFTFDTSKNNITIKIKYL